MRESIGEWFTLQLIIVFIFIVFGLLAATISYYKAFKVNSMILYSIDKFEGYNDYAQAEIESKLDTIGYLLSDETCPMRGSLVSITKNSKHLYCVYYYPDDETNNTNKVPRKDTGYKYYNYSVVTYIYVDLPLAANFKIPVHTKGERIYNFTDRQSPGY